MVDQKDCKELLEYNFYILTTDKHLQQIVAHNEKLREYGSIALVSISSLGIVYLWIYITRHTHLGYWLCLETDHANTDEVIQWISLYPYFDTFSMYTSLDIEFLHRYTVFTIVKNITGTWIEKRHLKYQNYLWVKDEKKCSLVRTLTFYRAISPWHKHSHTIFMGLIDNVHLIEPSFSVLVIDLILIYLPCLFYCTTWYQYLALNRYRFILKFYSLNWYLNVS